MIPLDFWLCPCSYSPGCSWPVVLLGLAADPHLSYYQNLQDLSSQAVPQALGTSLCYCAGLIYPWGRTWHYFLVNFMNYLSVHSSSLPRSI